MLQLIQMELVQQIFMKHAETMYKSMKHAATNIHLWRPWIPGMQYTAYSILHMLFFRL